MQITGPSPIYYLPENLWSLFSRPGREVTVRVLQIEGKLLYLELGGYRFQARLTGNLLPEEFRPGEVIRLKVVNTEGPIILQVLDHPKVRGTHHFLYLLVSNKRKMQAEEGSISKEWVLFRELLKGFQGSSEASERRLPQNLEDLLGKEIKFVEFYVEDDRLFIPFVLRDEKSWGYLEIAPTLEGAERVKIFILTLFLQYLGYLKAVFSYTENDLEVDLLFAEPNTYRLAKEYLQELRSELSFSGKFVKITLEQRTLTPGHIFELRG